MISSISGINFFYQVTSTFTKFSNLFGRKIFLNIYNGEDKEFCLGGYICNLSGENQTLCRNNSVDKCSQSKFNLNCVNVARKHKRWYG